MSDNKFNTRSRKDDGITFEEWLKMIDVALGFISKDDLPDVAFADFYEEGMSPREVARDLLEENGFGDF